MIRRRDIIEELEGRGYEVKEHETIKNGVEFKEICFMIESGICPIIYTDNIIEESDSLSDAVESVLNVYRNAEFIGFNTEIMMNPDFILKNVYIGLQKESNEDIIKNQTDFEGIEKYLYVRINEEAAFKLSCALFDTLKIDDLDIWRASEKNTFSKTQITSMAEMLYSMTGEKIEETDDVLKLYIVTNDMNCKGASAILDTKALKCFANKINNHRFIVLPSSIHEVIIIPDSRSYSIEKLNAMVTEINQTLVKPEERLSDQVYRIDV